MNGAGSPRASRQADFSFARLRRVYHGPLHSSRTAEGGDVRQFPPASFSGETSCRFPFSHYPELEPTGSSREYRPHHPSVQLSLLLGREPHHSQVAGPLLAGFMMCGRSGGRLLERVSRVKFPLFHAYLSGYPS
jgi:hypothetical protein